MPTTPHPTVARLSADDEQTLGRQIEAGVLAEQALVHRLAPGAHAAGPPSDASVAELRQLVAEGRQARERFLLANLGLVGLVARRSAARHDLAEQDLFQEGFLGLTEALLRYDYRRGCRFSTYAMSWIRCYVDRAVLTRLDTIELPPARIGRVRRLHRLQAELSQRLGREVGLGETAATVPDGRQAARDSLWLLTDPWSDDLDVAAPGGGVAGGDDAGRRALEALAVLPRAQREVLWWRYGFGGAALSRRQVAARLGLTPSRVRRLEELALLRLRGECAAAGRSAPAGQPA